FQTPIFELHFHRRPDVDLHAEQAFEPPPFRIVVKDFDGRMPVNAMDMMIAAHYDLVFAPLSGRKMFDLPNRTDNPFLVARIYHNARARLREDAAASFVIEHPIIL